MAIPKFTDLSADQLAAIRTIGNEFDRRRKMTADDLPDSLVGDDWYLLEFHAGHRVDFTVRISGRLEQGDPTTARVIDWAMAVRCLLAEIDPQTFRRAIARMRDKRKRGVRQGRRFAKVECAIRNARIVARAGSVKLADADAQLLVAHPRFESDELMAAENR